MTSELYWVRFKKKKKIRPKKLLKSGIGDEALLNHLPGRGRIARWLGMTPSQRFWPFYSGMMWASGLEQPSHAHGEYSQAALALSPFLGGVFLCHVYPISLVIFSHWNALPRVVSGLGPCGTTSRASWFKLRGKATSAMSLYGTSWG